MSTPADDLIPDGGLGALHALARPEGADSLRELGVSHEPNEVRLARLLTTERYVFGVETPFFGRREALEAVYNAVREAATGRTLRVVHLIGAPGAGKTRLLAETFAIIDPVERGISVLSVSCPPVEDHAHDSVVAQLVRHRFGLGPGDRESVARDRLLEGLEPLCEPRALSAAVRQLGFLAGLRATGPSADTPPADLVQFRRAALRQLVHVFAADLARAPQVIVLQQAQHLSADAAELLLAMASELAAEPLVLLFVGTAAPAVPLALPGAAPVEVAIAPLDDRDIARVVRAVLHHVEPLPDELVSALVAVAAGNPRLCEENVRLLIQQGLIVPGRASWSVAPTARPWVEHLAPSLEAASDARVASLAREAREVLEVASVFGETFWLDGVVNALRGLRIGARLSGGPVAGPVLARPDAPWIDRGLADEVVALLEGLVDLGLVAPEAHTLLDGQREYRFVHGRDRHILYAAMAQAAKATAHGLVAQWLAGLNLREPAPWLEILGEHFRLAGRNAAAARLFLRAAEAAADSYALARARGLYQRAIALIGLDRVALLVDALAGLGDLALRAGEHVLARTSFGAMLEATELLADVRLGATAWLKLAKAHRALGDYVRARTGLNHASELFRQVSDSRGVAAAMDELAKVEWLEGGQGGYDGALDFASRALEMRRRLGQPRPVAESLGTLANVRIQRGELELAQALLAEALELHRQLRDPAGEALCHVGLGAVAYASGELSKAIGQWREGLELAELVGDRDLVGAFLNNLGEAHLEQGHLARAATALAEAAEATAETGDLRTALDVARNLGALAGAQGEFESAMASLARARAIGEEIGARTALAQVWRTEGAVRSRRALAQGLPEEAEAARRCFDEAVQVFVEAGDRMELDRTVHAYAEHLRRHGDEAQASAVLALLDRR